MLRKAKDRMKAGTTGGQPVRQWWEGVNLKGRQGGASYRQDMVASYILSVMGRKP